MRFVALLFLLTAAVSAPERLPRDVAAAHAEGKWQIRKAQLYRHLVKYYRGYPSAKMVLPDYLRQRLIQYEASARKLVVTDDDVAVLMDRLDKEIKRRTGGTHTLDKERRLKGMSVAEFKRRMRLAVMRERVARDIVNSRDRTRNPNKELDDSTVVLTTDELYNNAKKILDPKQLKKGIIAQVGNVKVSAYQYGRELSFALPTTEVLSALNDLILVQEVKLLIGNDNPPTEEQLAAERKWFVTYEVNRLRRHAQGQGQDKIRITIDTVKQVLAGRGLTLELALSSPGSRAQARIRGHFRRGFDSSASEDEEEKAEKDAKLRKYYEAHKKHFGDRLRVARILIVARGQPVRQIGRKIRNLQQGKATAQALWVRASHGVDFGKLARENSDDVDVIKKNGGIVPLWLTADAPGWKGTWAHANALKEGTFSKPFFDAGRGFVIVKLIKRRKALGFAGLRDKIMAQATEQAYRGWRAKVLRVARKSKGLLDD